MGEPVTPRLDRGDLGVLILALLGEREMYGYEIAVELRRRTDDLLDLPEGTVYPALRRLERQKLVAGTWVDAGARPRRRYYRLTADGERALDAGRQRWRRFVRAADAILAR